jgi:hypothetical protein
MPAIGPEFTRRALLLAALAASLRADSADQVWELIGSLASSLTNGSGDDFLRAFDRSMPGFEQLRTNVNALISQADVQSSIDPVSNEGDDQKRTVEVDWLMRMTGHDSVSAAVKREERVKCRFEKQGKRWRIVMLEPLSFFAAPPLK